MGTSPPGGTAEIGQAPEPSSVPRSVVERMSCPPQVRRLGFRRSLKLRPLILAQICHCWQMFLLAKRIRAFEADCGANWADHWFLVETGFVPHTNEWWAFKKAQQTLSLSGTVLERLMAGIVQEFLRNKQDDRVLYVSIWIFQDLMTRIIGKPRIYREQGQAALRGLLSGLEKLQEAGRLDALRQDERSVSLIVGFVEHLEQAHEGTRTLSQKIKEKLT